MTKTLNRFQDWRPRLRQRPTRLTVCDERGMQLGDGGKRPNAIALARGIVRFRGFDLSAIAVAKRPAALRLQCTGWAPFPNAEFGVRLIDAYAEVFAWDRTAVERAASEAGVSIRGLRCYPESVLKGPVPDGVRLIATLDGFEAQRGEGGRLVASRWWPSSPSAEDWTNFQRGAGVAADLQSGEVPEAVTLPLGAPWEEWVDVEALAVRLPFVEQIAYAALCVALGVPLVWYGVDAFRAHRSLVTVQSAVETAERDAAPIIAARDEAMTANTRLRPLLVAFGEPSALSILGAVSRGIPDDGSQIREFEYRDGGVRIALAPSAILTGSSLVKAFESTGVFRDVNVTTGSGGLLTLTARIDVAALQRAGEAEAARTRAQGSPPPPRAAEAAATPPVAVAPAQTQAIPAAAPVAGPVAPVAATPPAAVTPSMTLSPAAGSVQTMTLGAGGAGGPAPTVTQGIPAAGSPPAPVGVMSPGVASGTMPPGAPPGALAAPAPAGPATPGTQTQNAAPAPPGAPPR